MTATDTKDGCKRVQEATKAVLSEVSNDERNNGGSEGITQGVETARAVLTTALLTDNC